jgi:hypothetical protein
MPNEKKKKASPPLHPATGERSDAEHRSPGDISAIRDMMLDKTLADSFPASDPPSSIPDPSSDSWNPDEPNWDEKRKDRKRAA